MVYEKSFLFVKRVVLKKKKKQSLEVDFFSRIIEKGLYILDIQKSEKQNFVNIGIRKFEISGNGQKDWSFFKAASDTSIKNNRVRNQCGQLSVHILFKKAYMIFCTTIDICCIIMHHKSRILITILFHDREVLL